MGDDVEFNEDHQSLLPQEEHTCGHCGATHTIGVPADSLSLLWECPDCDGKNRTEGEPPEAQAKRDAELNHARAVIAAHEAGETPPEHILASDSGEGADVHV